MKFYLFFYKNILFWSLYNNWFERCFYNSALKKDIFYFFPEILVITYLLISLITLVGVFSNLTKNVIIAIELKYILKKLTINACLRMLVFYQFVLLTIFLPTFIMPQLTHILHGFLAFNIYVSVSKFLISTAFIASAIFIVQFLSFEVESSLELPILFGFCYFFCLLLVSCFDLFITYLIIEAITFLICLLVAANYRSSLSLEAAIKYFISSSLSSGFILYSVFWFFALTSQTGFLGYKIFYFVVCAPEQLILEAIGFPLSLLVFGFLIKLGAFPFSVWVPDAYEGSPNFVTFLLIIGIKTSFILFIIRLFFFLFQELAECWLWLFLISAIGSFVFGSLGAYSQKTIKRFLAYTSLNQLGFVLLSLGLDPAFVGIAGVTSCLFFLINYIVNNILFFGVFLSFYKSSCFSPMKFLTDFKGFGYYYPWYAIILSVSIFSFIGIPPLAGFFSKFFTLVIAVKAGKFSIVFIALFSNGISAFYYIKLIKVIWFGSIFDFKIKPFYFRNFARNDLNILLSFCLSFNFFTCIFLDFLLNLLGFISTEGIFPWELQTLNSF